jgi:hypothetical protein
MALEQRAVDGVGFLVLIGVRGGDSDADGGGREEATQD